VSQCKFSTTGDFNLDITFSDHRFSKTTLQAFGAVIASIHRVCDDGQLRFWTFIYYVSTRRPDVLGANMPDERKKCCEAVVERANPPPAAIEQSERAKLLRESNGPEDNAAEGAAAERPRE
jgi:hypothetical protein